MHRWNIFLEFHGGWVSQAASGVIELDSGVRVSVSGQKCAFPLQQLGYGFEQVVETGGERGAT
jgi:hypothetical protein